MKKHKSHTENGFQCLEFSFETGSDLTLQQSSAAQEDFLWLGLVLNKDNTGRPHISRNEAKEIAKVLLDWSDSGELFKEKIVPEKDAEIHLRDFYDRSIKCMDFIEKYQFSGTSPIPTLSKRFVYILKNNPGLNGQESEEVLNALIVWSMSLSQWSDMNYNTKIEILPVHNGFNCRLLVDHKLCTDDKENEIKKHVKYMKNAYIWGMENICKELGMKD